MDTTLQVTIQIDLAEWQFCILIQILPKLIPLGPTAWKSGLVSIVSGNGLVLYRQETTRTNVDQIVPCQHAITGPY